MWSRRRAPHLARPHEAASDVVAIVGRRGRGKTTTAVVLVEEAHEAGRRFCVVDPTGAWWGLRSSRDGKSPGIPCVVFGGKHAMAPLEPTAGKVLAEFVADPTQPSVVLDIKLWSRGEQVRFLADFLSTLYQKNDAQLLLVLDEADQVAPQRAESPGENVMLGAASRLVKLGRVSGFGVVLVTQRPATLNKNVMNMAGVLISLGLTGPQDHDAVLAWMKHRADAAKAKEILSSLPGLPQGRAWVWAPELDVLKLVDIRDRETFDSSATPKGGTAVQPRALAEVDLDGISAAVKATIERAKANDPGALKARVAQLERELAKKPTPEKAPPPKPVEISVLQDEHVRRLEAAVARVEKETVSLGQEAQKIRAALAAARKPGGAHAEIARAGAGRGTLAPPAPRPKPAAPSSRPAGETLPKAQQRILDATAWLAGVGVVAPDKTQVALFADLAPGAGYTGNQFGALRAAGLIDYPTPGTVTITADGRARADTSNVPQTAQEMQQQLLSKLPKAQRQILEVLIAEYPSAISKEDASTRAHLQPGAGYTGNQFGRLRSLGLIDYPEPGRVAALPVLFLEGA